MIRNAMIAAILTVLISCAQVVQRQNEESPLLRAILPPESLGRSLSLSQQVVGEFQDQKQAWRVEIELTPESLAMVGLTHLGVPVFSLEQVSGRIEAESLGAGGLPFDPRYILSDFQIAFWPAPVLRTRLQSIGLDLEQDPVSGARRVLGGDGERLVEITYLDETAEAGDLVVEHFDLPYRLWIKTSDASEPEDA